jgi:hypothetical protein
MRKPKKWLKIRRLMRKRRRNLKNSRHQAIYLRRTRSRKSLVIAH